jgi:putative modified peptide
VRKLLDKLSTDNEFRRLFKKDAAAALAKVGYVVGAGEGNVGTCLQLAASHSIAPKANFVRDRAKLESALAALPFNFTFDCPPEFKA